ncbi:g10573 [Coccomyxa elongata]
MACCVSGELDASGACLGAATSIDLQGAPCQGMIDTAGFCCYGVVDAFGVCNGWDASGRIALTLLAKPSSAASAAAIAGYLGIDVNSLHSVTSDPGVPASAGSMPNSTGSSQQRRMLLATNSATVQFYIDASTPSSRATTSTTLTIGQVEYLLDMAVTSAGSNAELAVLDVAAVAVCGNSVCEIGERPVANTSSTVGSAGCPIDCPVEFVPCPVPPGSASPCGGRPRGVCASASGACACGRGYTGNDCISCSAGFYRQGSRCLGKPAGKMTNA